MSKTGAELAQYALAQVGRPYWWGTFGQTASEELLAQKRRQYPAYYTAADFPRQYGRRVHDCVGLINGCLWSDSPDSPPRYDASQDVAVSGLYERCGERGTISSMPDEPGVCVFFGDMSHVGVYVGGGSVVEARGHAVGVVRSRLADGRWRLWGKPKWFDYGNTSGAQTAEPEPAGLAGLPELARGSAGEYVHSAQLLLIGRGYDCGSSGADGEFGSCTELAAVTFQRARGLEPDGIVGARTWARLIGG